MRIAVLGPGGVGGLLAGALERSGAEVTVIARESTAQTIRDQGLRISSVKLGDFVSRPRVLTRLTDEVDALILATKAAGLQDGLERVASTPPLVLPLLNGLDHVALLRRSFAPETVLAGTIRVEADRPEPGVIVHTSPFLLVEIASRYESARAGIEALVQALDRAGVSARADRPIAAASEAQVMWSKLVRLNALACTTSAYDKLLGEIRSTPALRADLIGAIEESCAAGQAEGADNVNPEKAIRELENAHETLGSSMQRDIAAGRAPEVDAIPGAVLRAAARHGLKCPTIERLVAMILARVEGAGVNDIAS
jgi:2-dehydropantoate 2-reductase